MVDTNDKARHAAARFRREEVDLIFLYVSTYALSSTVLPVVQEARVPVVVLTCSPWRNWTTKPSIAWAIAAR